MACWQEIIQHYGSQRQNRLGKIHTNVDALSRRSARRRGGHPSLTNSNSAVATSRIWTMANDPEKALSYDWLRSGGDRSLGNKIEGRSYEILCGISSWCLPTMEQTTYHK